MHVLGTRCRQRRTKPKAKIKTAPLFGEGQKPTAMIGPLKGDRPLEPCRKGYLTAFKNPELPPVAPLEVTERVELRLFVNQLTL